MFGLAVGNTSKPLTDAERRDTVIQTMASKHADLVAACHDNYACIEKEFETRYQIKDPGEVSFDDETPKQIKAGGERRHILSQMRPYHADIVARCQSYRCVERKYSAFYESAPGPVKSTATFPALDKLNCKQAGEYDVPNESPEAQYLHWIVFSRPDCAAELDALVSTVDQRSAEYKAKAEQRDAELAALVAEAKAFLGQVDKFYVSASNAQICANTARTLANRFADYNNGSLDRQIGDLRELAQNCQSLSDNWN